jgi:putative intracellular protease/amidase
MTMAMVLMPIPSEGFDPTEAAVPWKTLRALGDEVAFATQDGKPGRTDVQGMLLPGGHAPGVIPCLESDVLQSQVASAFDASLPVGPICHGVALAARVDFVRGPMSSKRDTPVLGPGGVRRDSGRLGIAVAYTPYRPSTSAASPNGIA